MWKLRDEDLIDVVHWIDRTLIKFCKKFGTYNKDDPQSFSLSASFNVFPQFMYHLRRSPFMSTFNATPDLTISLRHSLLLEDVTNSLFMIQPTLMKYALDAEPQPVILDLQSIDKSVVLMMDTFFKVAGTGFLMSLTIEILQLPFADRTSDVDDLILNTLGVVTGYVLFVIVRYAKNLGKQKASLPGVLKQR